MLQNLKSKRQEGFTIIEVMIVLVIAAVILLIVFLAVPALQRNSRNTQYNNEAAALSSASSEWVANSNNGSVPSTAADYTAFNGAIKGLANTKNITSVTGQAYANTAVTPTTSAATIEFGATCGTTGAASTTPNSGSSRQVIVIFGVETNSGTIAKCVQSGV